MTRTLGICATTTDCLSPVLGLARAGRRAGVPVEIFLTGDGVALTQDRRFPELLRQARIGVCEVSYRARGFAGRAVTGLDDKDFVTQARHAELVQICDRYLVL